MSRVGVPRVATREEWSAARERLLARERDLIGMRDAVTEERRQLPMIEVVKDYVFHGPGGSVGLPDLFAERQQLIVYHFWFEPGEEPCPGCSWWLDNDVGYTGGAQITVFLREGEKVFRTYTTSSGRMLETVSNHWTLLELTPLGAR